MVCVAQKRSEQNRTENLARLNVSLHCNVLVSITLGETFGKRAGARTSTRTFNKKNCNFTQITKMEKEKEKIALLELPEDE